VAFALAVLPFAGCARAPQAAGPTASPAAASEASRSAAQRPPERASAPRATALEVPRAPAIPAPSPDSAPSSVAPLVTPSGPQIISISTSPSIVRDGAHVVWSVRTSADVVSVTAQVSAYTLPLVRQAAGRFELAFAVPSNIPSFFHGTYNLLVTARSRSGATADRTVSVVFE
jgi:hypothetical protein